MTTKLGTVTKEKDGFRVAFERVLNHPIDVVWDAISNPEKLKIWFTDFEMTPQTGSPVKIIFRDDAKTITNGEVIEINPPHRFVWTWEGELAVWELSSLGENKTKLLFTYSKLDEKYAVGASGGFHTLMERLEKMLNGSNETYPFGTEEHDPAQAALREEYGKVVFDAFPELEAHSPVSLQRTFHVSASRLWEALTNNEQLKQWYFDFKGNFKPQVGHVFEWTAGPPNGKQWLHRGKILDVEQNKRLVHSWGFPGYSGEARLTWTLTPISESSTQLKLHFEFLKPFDFKEPALRRKNFVEGWNSIINESLAKFLS